MIQRTRLKTGLAATASLLAMLVATMAAKVRIVFGRRAAHAG
jgi:hypothetical protein